MQRPEMFKRPPSERHYNPGACWQYLGTCEGFAAYHDLYVRPYVGGWEVSTRYADGKFDNEYAVIPKHFNDSEVSLSLCSTMLELTWKLAIESGVMTDRQGLPPLP